MWRGGRSEEAMGGWEEGDSRMDRSIDRFNAAAAGREPLVSRL